MSTTIYNAYKITIPEESTILSFCKDISNICLAGSFENYCKSVASKIIDLTERLPMLQCLDPDAYTRLRDDIITSTHMIPEPNQTKEEALCEQEAFWTAIDMIESYLHSSHDYAESALVIFDYPNSQNEYLIIAYGSILTNLLETPNDDMQSLMAKYSICDYHYQNQTDKPDDITPAEWEKRRETWEKVMPSDIPSIDGMHVVVCNNTKALMNASHKTYETTDTKQKVRQILAQSNNDERLKQYANDIACVKYICEEKADTSKNNNKYSDMHFANEYIDNYNKPGTKANSVFEEAKEQIRLYINNYTSENIDAENIFGLIKLAL